MKLLIIQMQKEMIVLKICLVAILLTSCNTRSVINSSRPGELYEIIESKIYNNSVLFYKKIPSSEISHWRLDYKSLNSHNYNQNWILERERFVNFDTIFHPDQQRELDRKLKSFESIVLEPTKLKNPNILYTPKKLDDGDQVNKVGLEKVSFPFIQEGLDGKQYGFIYRENPTEGIFFIYKLTNGIWEEFAKVHLWIT